MKAIVRFLLFFITTNVLLLTSCDINFEIDDIKPVLELECNTLRLTEGDNCQMEIDTIVPEDMIHYLIWSSSDTTVVKVDMFGNVRAIHEGTAHIMVKDPDNKVSDSCYVKVSPYTKCLTFSTDKEGESSVFSMTDMWADIQYSYNRIDWVTYEEGTPLEFGDEKLYIRGEYNDSPHSNISSPIGYIHFDGDADVRCTGNIMNLLNYHDPKETTIHCPYRLESLFQDCVQLIEAPELPATVLSEGCYMAMFYGCSKLVKAPELPVKSLSPLCCYAMFAGCTSLSEVPETLPAEKMSFECYAYMFASCTSITKAPLLPATVLDDSCYLAMFSDCTSLSEVPENLPAQEMSFASYAYMFKGCEQITKAPSISAAQLEENCFKNMFEGCTSLTEAPVLHATEMKFNCYYAMFSGCTSLTKAPDLLARHLEHDCYTKMFAGCVALKYIKAMFIDCDYRPSNNFCQITDMIDPVASGTFVKNAAATWPDEAILKPGWSVTLATE